MFTLSERAFDTQEEASAFFHENLEFFLQAFPRQDFNLMALEGGKFIVVAEEECHPLPK